MAPAAPTDSAENVYGVIVNLNALSGIAHRRIQRPFWHHGDAMRSREQRLNVRPVLRLSELPLQTLTDPADTSNSLCLIQVKQAWFHNPFHRIKLLIHPSGDGT